MKKKRSPLRGVVLSRFLGDILYNQIQTRFHYDTKANWLLVISGGMMTILIPHLKEAFVTSNIGIIILFISAFIAFIFSLLIFKPPKILTGRKELEENLMYYKSFKNLSLDEYVSRLKKIDNDEKIIGQYAKNIMSLTKNSLIVKDKLARWPIYILLFGTIIGVLVLLYF